MSPVLAEANEEALQPLLNDEITQAEAFDRGVDPFTRTLTSPATRLSHAYVMNSSSVLPEATVIEPCSSSIRTTSTICC